MHVRLLTTPRHAYGAAWPAVGDTMEVPDGLAAYMIERGEAEAVKAEKPPAPEAAVVAPTERAVKPKPHGRKG